MNKIMWDGIKLSLSTLTMFVLPAGAVASLDEVTTSRAVTAAGPLIVNSPWISNTAPFQINPPTIPLAPFSVPFPYAGAVNSSTNGVPFIPGVTGNNANTHAITLDSRNLAQPQGTFLATVTPGINANAQLALMETVDLNDFSNITSRACNPNSRNPSCVLPVATCTTTSNPLSLFGSGGPNAVLTVTPTGILPASNAPNTTTEVMIGIQGGGLQPGFYAATATFSAGTISGVPVLDGTGAPVAVAVPICLEVGNNTEYQFFDASNNFTNIAAGSASGSSGLLFMEAGGEPQTLEADIFALGPSLDPRLTPAGLVPGAAIFGPPATNLQIPVTMNPSSGNPTWINPPTFPAGSGLQMGQDCAGTQAANSCTPASGALIVSPVQSTAAGIYNTAANTVAGPVATNPGFTVVPLVSGATNPLAATLPVYLSAGPSVITNPPAIGNPLGNIASGSVVNLVITNPGSMYTTAPQVHFTGGCVNEPTALAIIDPTQGTVSRIVLTSLGGQCTTQPNVAIGAPASGGTQATAISIISDATVNITVTGFSGSSNTSPASHNVWVLPSDSTISIDSIGPLSYNSPNPQTWLDFDATMCAGNIPFNPNQAQSSFFNGCQLQFVPNPTAASSLPPGTYYAWVVVQAHSPAMPATTAVVVQLNMIVITPPCVVVITDSRNNNFGTTMPVTGTSTAGYWPSNPLSLTVGTFQPFSCPAWTATVGGTAAGVAPFVNIVSGASGDGAGTIQYNAFANTLLSARSNTITVTAGSATATYTISEPASSDSLLNREVSAAYQRILGREGDTGGFNYWSCLAPAPAPCANLGVPGLGQIADSFVTSWEGEYTGYQVLAIYQSVLGTAPNFATWSAARSTFLANDNANGWAAAGQALANTLVNSNAWGLKFGSVTNTNLVVTTIYMNTLGRPPSTTELSTGVAAILGGGSSGLYAELQNLWGSMVNPANIPPNLNPTEPQNLIFTTQAYQATTNPLYIDYLYYAILARDIDNGGFTFWLNSANTLGGGLLFNGSLANRLIIEGDGTPGAGFIGSPEFQGTFNH